MPRSVIPWSLVVFRLLAGPALIAVALLSGDTAAWISVVLLSLGVVSDIFDGIIARRLKVSTPKLRRYDSRADVLFWASATIAVHLMHPALLPSTGPVIATLIAMEGINHAFSFARFGREASPHHYLSKAFGLALWGLFIQLYLTGQGGWPLYAAFALGAMSQIEAFAITARLREWRCDVPSVFRLER